MTENHSHTINIQIKNTEHDLHSRYVCGYGPTAELAKLDAEAIAAREHHRLAMERWYAGLEAAPGERGGSNA